MALGTVRLHPTMEMGQLVAALNENFALIENLNRTTIYKDKTGKARVIIGALPDGTYGFVISKPGHDVVDILRG